jgi:hypothetical protein
MEYIQRLIIVSYCSIRAFERIMPGFDSQRSGPDLLVPGLTIVLVAENTLSVFLLLDKAIESVLVIFARLAELLFPDSSSLVDYASLVCRAGI